MKRFVKKSGDIFKFPTIENQHGYCQWLPHITKYLLISTSNNLSIDEIIKLPEAFLVVTYNDTPNRYGWEKIGNAPFDEKYNEYSVFAKQDIITKKITKYKEGPNGYEIPASYDEVKDLEIAAVWAHPNIVERLLSKLNGETSKLIEDMKIKLI